MRYYDHLVEQYDNPKRSQELLKLEFRIHLVGKFKNAANLDSDSKLGTYLEVNTNLELKTRASFESERILITRYMQARITSKLKLVECVNLLFPGKTVYVYVAPTSKH